MGEYVFRCQSYDSENKSILIDSQTRFPIVWLFRLVESSFLADFKLFSQFKNDFNGIDGHALFIGTVIHSLDHYLIEKYTEPLMFDVNCYRYQGSMYRSVRVDAPMKITLRANSHRAVRGSQIDMVK